MATNANSNPDPVMLPEIGPDGIARESPVIAYTEKVFSSDFVFDLENCDYMHCLILAFVVVTDN